MGVTETILGSYFAVNVIYPFLLIFTLIFAILQRSKILGDNKKQIDALVALSVALIAVAFSYATGIISKLMPFLAVAVVILLVFLILYGFVASSNEKGLIIPPSVQWGFFVLIVIAVIIAVIWATGQLDTVYGWVVNGGQPTGIATNILLVAIIVGAMIVVLAPWKKKDS
ncbi:MAG TPA: hypothetical protein VI815_00850 [Candidatus Nanoarchaeia archaeon]|nr:hypothetical protein [Candidatus Nanoarchaeia archaeon]